MKVVVHPSAVSGTISAPPSKSAMQRACAAALLTGGITTIQNPGTSNDDEAALDIIQQFGAVITRSDNEIIIDSSKSFLFGDTNEKNELKINCGESGLSIRMFTPVAALSTQPVTINGSGSLAKRPMIFFDEILPKIGVEITSLNGYIPLHVQGPLKPVSITIDGSLSSQFLTGLLMAYSASDACDVTIEVIDLKSKPYIALTLAIMEVFNMKVPLNEKFEKFHFSNAKQSINANYFQYKVEGDWSGAAFLLISAAVNGSAIIKGLDINSTQADKKIMEALKDCGASMQINGDTITINQSQLLPFTFDATDCPDLFPPLVALAAYCNGKTILTGISRLAHKESNRAITLQEQFGKLGVEILLQGDKMIINSNGEVQGCSVHSCHDHRIAMACAVAALKANTPVIIDAAEAINKSYPEFYSHLQQLSVKLEIISN